MKLFLVVSSILIAASAAFAQGPAQATTPQGTLKKKLVVKKPVEVENTWAMSLDVTRSMSLYDLKNGNKYDGMDYSTGISIGTSIGKFATELSVTQILSPNEEDSVLLNDSNISYSMNPISLKKDKNSVDLAWNPTVTAVLPLSKASRDGEQLQTIIVGSLQLMMQAGEETAMKGLSLVTSLTAGKYFHQYETDKNGDILNSYSSNQSISLGYTNSGLSLGLSYANMMRWPYLGDMKNIFSLSESISYAFSNGVGILLGHTNKANVLKPNGYESNISIVDDDNSIVYLSVNYGFGGKF